MSAKINKIDQDDSKLLKYLLCFAIFLFALEHLSSMAEVKLNVAFDAAGYLRHSKIPFFSIDYWLGMRPVGYPTFIKLMHHNPNQVAAIQSLLYMTSWSFFSLYIYTRSRNKLFGFFSGLTILFIAVQPDIALWSHHILTESLTFTFIPWASILLYEFLISERKQYFYILLFLLVYFSTIRDVNTFYIATFIIIFAILYFYNYINKVNFILSSTLLVFALFFSNYTTNHAGNTIMEKRWIFPYFNLVGHRFLTNSELLQYMQKEGMPVNEALLRKKNVWASRKAKDDMGFGWYDDPELKNFREWVAQSGKTKYTKFLLTHPAYTFGQIYAHKDEIFHYLNKPHHFLKGYKIDNTFTYSKIRNETFYKYLFILISVIIVLSFILKKTIINKYTIPMLTLLLPIGLLTVVTFHGDAMEVHRHTLIIPILLKVTMFMLAYALGNELFIKNRTL